MMGKIKVECSYSYHNGIHVLRCSPEFETRLAISRDIAGFTPDGKAILALHDYIKHSVMRGLISALRDATNADIASMIKSFLPPYTEGLAERIRMRIWDIISHADIFECEMFGSTTLDILRNENKELNRVNSVLNKELSVLKGRMLAAKRKKFYGRKMK